MKQPVGKIVGDKIVESLAEFNESDPLYWMDVADRDLDRQVYGSPTDNSNPNHDDKGKFATTGHGMSPESMRAKTTVDDYAKILKKRGAKSIKVLTNEIVYRWIDVDAIQDVKKHGLRNGQLSLSPTDWQSRPFFSVLTRVNAKHLGEAVAWTSSDGKSLIDVLHRQVVREMEEWTGGYVNDKGDRVKYSPSAKPEMKTVKRKETEYRQPVPADKIEVKVKGKWIKLTDVRQSDLLKLKKDYYSANNRLDATTDNFNPDQPRVPAGQPGGGRFGGSGEDAEGTAARVGLPEHKMPPEPTFLTKKLDVIGQNMDAIAEMKNLAGAGDYSALFNHPGTPSPKVQEYKQALIKASQEHLKQSVADIDKPPVSPTPHTTSSGGTTPSPDSTSFVKKLPGSTQPDLVKDGEGGLWVKKSNPSNPGHVRNEAEADAIYKAIGVPVPESSIHETDAGPVKMAKFIEGGQTLGEWQSGKTNNEIDAMNAQIGKHYAADCLLGNWDVIGLGKDNILIKDGVAHRIDNGGALRYRAQGTLKLPGAFGDQVTEIATMHSMSKNPSAASVFGSLSENEVYGQMKELVGKKDKILAAAVDPETKEILGKRLDYMKGLVEQKEAVDGPISTTPTPYKPPVAPVPLSSSKPPIVPVPSSSKPPPSSSGSATPAIPGTPSHLLTGEGLAAHLAKKAKFTGKYAKLYEQKIAALNPDGITSGIMKVPLTANPDKLYPHLPAGVSIVKVHAPAKKLGLSSGVLTEDTGKGGKFGDVDEKTPSTPSPSTPTTAPSGKWEVDLDAHSNPVIASLTSGERAAIVKYTGNYYSVLNTKMRECPPEFECLEGDERKNWERMESGLAKAPPFPKPVLLHRGMHLYESGKITKFLGDLQAAMASGAEFQLPCITSTSTSSHRSAANGSGSFGMRILAKTGLFVKSISLHSSESEVIKSAKAKYKVTQVEKLTNGGHVIHMEEI